MTHITIARTPPYTEPRVALCMACQGWGCEDCCGTGLWRAEPAAEPRQETEREYAIRVLREEMR